jgi:hypothetical protein
MTDDSSQLIAWLPELIYRAGRFESGLALVCDAAGNIARMVSVDQLTGERRINLPRRAMLPGMVNAHSHAFQRVIRGKTEYRNDDKSPDSFWTWRELMYSAATRLTPEDIYDASRMAFLEMALSGITAVGEFHYLHHAPDGSPYDDPNMLAGEVIPLRFLPPIESGIMTGLKGGLLAQYGYQDARIELYDGSWHDVDSTDLAFFMAGAMALQNALSRLPRAPLPEQGGWDGGTAGVAIPRPGRPPSLHDPAAVAEPDDLPSGSE